ncbi:PQQ-binding-like beta-propeller repeat protein [Candidatus Bathyarchaeota archaeon]|nr:PQQ-binding-like beta-propeller repeat protein [Candidatus Bathyarchaeota archaeon]
MGVGMPSGMKHSMVKNGGLLAIILLGLFLSSVKPSMAQEGEDVGSLSSMEVDFGDLPTAIIPLDKGIKHVFKVRNLGEKELRATLEVTDAETGMQVGTVFPQPSRFYLSPGEEQWVIVAGVSPEIRPEDLAREAGVRNRLVKYAFRNDYNQSDTITLFVNYTYTVLDPRMIAGNFTIRGKVMDQTGNSIRDAEVRISTGNYEKVSRTGADGEFSFSVPPHPNWWLKVSKQGYKDEYVFDPTDAYYAFKLKPFSEEKPKYELVKLVTTEIGFWKYAISADEKYILLCQGMENWVNPGLKNQSKLMFYTLDGEEVWSYPMEWEAWGADLSQDGKYAVYAAELRPGSIGLIDAQTGTPLWKKSLTAENFPSSIPAEVGSKEVVFSHNSMYIGMGSGHGDFYLLERATGNVLWRYFTEGQVRRVLFSRDDRFVYVGSGDGWLYKLDAEKGALQWKAHVWSWPYTYGLAFSPDESLIAAGVKSGEVSVVRTSDGKRLWHYDMGIMCVRWVQFSPDGSLLAAGSGAPGGTTIFNATTGEPLWRTFFSGAGMFTADGDSVFIGEGAGRLFTRDGTLITDEIEPGFEGYMTRGYWKVAYISKDESKIVLAPRDMEPGKGGIAFFKMVETPEPTPTPKPIPGTNPPTSQTGPSAPPPESATPSASLYIISAVVAVMVLVGVFMKMRK